MKNIKTISIFTVFLFFTYVSSIAQNNNVTRETWDFQGFLDVNNDLLFGTETMIAETKNSSYQVKFIGEYKDYSGNIYTWDIVVIDDYINSVDGKIYTQTFNCANLIECECEPIAFYRIKFKIVINSNKEILVKRIWGFDDSLADL